MHSCTVKNVSGFRVFFALGLFALAGCTTNVQSNPPRTATEELLISTAAERAAAQLALQIPPEALVFVDNSNFDGTDSKFAIAEIRARLLQQGMQLIDDRKKADIIVETRSGALSTDRKTVLVGIPQFNIPIPFASTPLGIPEVALYSKEEQKGVAKFAIISYSAKSGTLVSAQAPQYGFSHNIRKTFLVFFTSTDNDALPADAEEKVRTGTQPVQPSK